MAETTPGPLIMVAQFVGFMGAFRDPGALSPLLAGTPRRSAHHVGQCSAALAAVTAAVVGVILNLAVWFGFHVLFDEVWNFTGLGMNMDVAIWRTFDPAAAALTAAVLLAVFYFRLGIFTVLAGSAAAGVLLHFSGLASV